MSESKMAKAIIAGMSNRNFDAKLLAHYLTQEPDIQTELFDLVESLLDLWTDNFQSGRFYGEADRRVQERASGISLNPKSATRTKTNKDLPSDNIWD